MNPLPNPSTPIADQRLHPQMATRREHPRAAILVNLGAAALMGGLFLTTGLLPPMANHARAAAPLVSTQAPGFHRLMLGEFEVTVLSDGTVSRPMDQVLSKPEEVREVMCRNHQPVETRLSVNAYKVHFTETCGEAEAHLVTHVEATSATLPDISMTGVVHLALSAKGLLPAEHLADAGYVSADHLVSSGRDHGVDPSVHAETMSLGRRGQPPASTSAALPSTGGRVARSARRAR